MSLVRSGIAIIACMALPQGAPAATLAPEGKVEFVFCFGGEVRNIEHSKDVTGGAMSVTGPVRSMTEGDLLDLSAASCHNAFTVVLGKINEYGFCELQDGDGDRLFFAFTSDNRGGKWTGYPGTGKFQSLLWQGEWERMGPFPSTGTGKVQGCQRYQGSYRQTKGTELQPSK